MSAAVAATLAAAPLAQSTPATKTPAKTEAKAGKTAMKADAVMASDLPKAVTDTVMKAHPKGTIASATKAMHGTMTVYAVKVTDAGKNATMNVNEDGTMAGGAAKGKGKKGK